MILTLVQNVSIHAYVSKEGKINLQTTRFFRFYQILSIYRGFELHKFFSGPEIRAHRDLFTLE